MGKQTRSHPVSLNVIRGAAEFGGFKLGKLRQVDFDKLENVAYYTTTIDRMPGDCGTSPTEIKGCLNDLFSLDVLCTFVSLNSNGTRTARIMTGDFDKAPPPAPRSVEELTPEERADIPF